MQAIEDAIKRHQNQPGALLPALHDIQDAIGYIPDEAVVALAQGFNLSRAEVHGVVTFYHHFRRQPPGRHRIQVCRAEACQAMGSNELLAHAEVSLGCQVHETTRDGRVSLEPVYCLGLCACSPAIMIDNQVHARVTPERFDALVSALESPNVQTAGM